MTPAVAFYLLGSIAVGFLGRNRKIGVLGFLIISLLITPVLALLVLLLTAENPTPESER